MAPQPHIVIFPFMAQGHTLPLLDLSKAFSHRGIKVTIITTPLNAPSIRTYVHKHPNIYLMEIPFPRVDSHFIPEGCENTSQLPSMEFLPAFLAATTHLKHPFERVLQDMSDTGSLPICVISDFFLGWTLKTCCTFEIPRLVFHGMSVLSMAISKTAWVHAPHLKAASDLEPLHMPGLKLPFALRTIDLPDSLRTPNHDDSFSKFVDEVAQADVESWGIIVNSFFELEQTHITSFESFYMDGAKAWCLGPLLLYNEADHGVEKSPDQYPTAKCMKWLTEQAMLASVIYVSFGTQADVSDSQLDEVAFGLETSEYPFLWVVRSKTWAPPEGMEERIKGKGLIMREWVDQKRILKHRATGGFLSHCGWNSVLESLSIGVPILAWPMMAEQSLNAKHVVDGLNAGISVLDIERESNTFIGRKTICQGVRDLMGGNKASTVRERAQALGRAASRAVQEGGSSYNSLTELVNKLCATTGQI